MLIDAQVSIFDLGFFDGQFAFCPSQSSDEYLSGYKEGMDNPSYIKGVEKKAALSLFESHVDAIETDLGDIDIRLIAPCEELNQCQIHYYDRGSLSGSALMFRVTCGQWEQALHEAQMDEMYAQLADNVFGYTAQEI